jgi:hypothetical protein
VHSNQSYNLQGSDLTTAFSAGAIYKLHLPKYRAKLDFELFNFNFIFNEPWLDYSRFGGKAAGQFPFYKKFHVFAQFGFYQDNYAVQRPKHGQCATAVLPEDASSLPENVVSCTREDSGQFIELGMYWKYNRFMRITGKSQILENRNAKLKEFDETGQVFIIEFTMAFPNVGRTMEYVSIVKDPFYLKETF